MHCSPSSRCKPGLTGIIYVGGIVPARVVVFLDWQNVYKSARDILHDRCASLARPG
jgi:hypothetical protein